jgi:GTPase involved in cell partitioning and DNA repair
VPGAHTGKGRGTDFLAHLQRARCLALVLDMTGGNEQQEQQLVPHTPQEQLAILQVRAAAGL